ncbi:MAG: hypothetical protein FWF15_02115 [Oscillospiraceae bacterium]|nr:hypothetical protein [Oscillospiraceae bacterium]
MAWTWWVDFDKRFIGQWKREDGARVLSIRQNSESGEVEVKISWLPDGGHNFPALYTECDKNSLCFFHNDRFNRAEYILTLTHDDFIKCEFTQVGLTEEPIIRNYERIAHIPYDLDPPKPTVALKDAPKIDILKEYAEYGDIKSDLKFEFKFDERENMLDILGKYNLDELVKDKSDVDTAIALMHWFCARYRHGNPDGGGLAKERTPQALMDYADQHEGRTNCRGLAITLAQLIRAYNIKTFHVTCMPYEQPFDDCHVVVSVYCESLGKWIMLDPSANLYLKNKAGEIIGVEEFRDILLADGELFANPESTNWGNEGSMTNLDGYRDYMAKNLMRIERYGISSYGKDWQGGKVVLIPQKYYDNEAKNFDEAQQKNFITSREYFWQS